MDLISQHEKMNLTRTITNGVAHHFTWFIGVYFLLFVIVRLLMTSTASLDESEQIMLAQYFAWGYNAQPPLYTWLLQLLFKVVGTSILGLTILKSTLLFIAYLFVYKTGKLLTNNELKASLGSLSLMLLSQIIWGAQVDQTHTVLLTTATSMTLYYFFKIALNQAKGGDFVLFGISAAIGLLAKYNFVLILIGLTATASAITSFRGRFMQKRLFISIAVCLTIVLPHFIWFLSHFDLATSRSIERMHGTQTGEWLTDALSGLTDLSFSFVAFLSPFWLIFLGLFRKELQRDDSLGTKAISVYIATLLILLVIIILATGTTNIKERWLQPYLYILPLFMFMQTSLERINSKVRIYIWTSLGMSLLVAVVMLATPRVIDLREKPSRTNYPFKQLAYQLKDIIKKDTLIYAEDMFIGGNLLLSFPDVTAITASIPLQPYTIGNDVVVVYHQTAPKEFLDKLSATGFTCKASSIEEKYTYSNKQTYELDIVRCQKDIPRTQLNASPSSRYSGPTPGRLHAPRPRQGSNHGAALPR